MREASQKCIVSMSWQTTHVIWWCTNTDAILLVPYGHLGGQIYSELTIGLSASPHDSCGVHVASTMSSHHGGMHGDAVAVYHDG